MYRRRRSRWQAVAGSGTLHQGPAPGQRCGPRSFRYGAPLRSARGRSSVHSVLLLPSRSATAGAPVRSRVSRGSAPRRSRIPTAIGRRAPAPVRIPPGGPARNHRGLLVRSAWRGRRPPCLPPAFGGVAIPNGFPPRADHRRRSARRAAAATNEKTLPEIEHVHAPARQIATPLHGRLRPFL